MNLADAMVAAASSSATDVTPYMEPSKLRFVLPAVIGLVLVCVAVWGELGRVSHADRLGPNAEISVGVEDFVPLDTSATSPGRVLTVSIIDRLVSVRSLHVAGPELGPFAASTTPLCQYE